MSLAYIKLFFSYRTDFEALDNGEIGNLLMGALDYAEHHIDPLFTGNEKYIWPIIRGQIDREQQSYEEISQKRREAAKASHDQKDASSNASKCKQLQANAPKKKKMNNDYEEEFNIFWSAYPKKKSKADAMKVWKKLNPPLDKVLEAIEKQKRSSDWIKDNGQYIPYPKKWLLGMCWEDEVDQGMLFGHVHVDASDPHSYDKYKNEIDELNNYDD